MNHLSNKLLHDIGVVNNEDHDVIKNVEGIFENK